MITYIHNEERQIGDETYIWFIGNCLSTDVKPTDLVYPTSKLFELDTFKSFIFNGSAWLPVSSGGGSGSILTVTETRMEIDDETIYILDKTWEEIKSADIAILKRNEFLEGSIVEAVYHMEYVGQYSDYCIVGFISTYNNRISTINYGAPSPSDYPSRSESGK